MGSIKKKSVLIFSKETGNIQCVSEDEKIVDGLNTEKFCYKIVEMGVGDYYIGSYEDGQICNITEKPLVYERDLLDETYIEIMQQYPLYRQINIILEVLDKNENIVKTDRYNEFKKYLELKKKKLNIKIKHLSSDEKAFTFISNEKLTEAYLKDVKMFDN
jgi:hypothetical protein